MLSPSEINPNKVALYIRWSTDDQGEGTTLETQLERCRYYLGSQGWAFNEKLVYVDDGHSGGTLDRPALTKLRKDVKAGKVECVVVYKIDRLSRSVVDIVQLVLREWEGQCFVKSASEDVNTISPAGKMFFYILVSFAEYERSVIKERTMAGKVKRAEQGLNPGFRPPYGYTKGASPGTIELVDYEASTVRRIFSMYLKGNGTFQIAQALNLEGLTRRGELWNQQMIKRILRNPAYVGVLEYGRRMRTSKEQRERHGLKSAVFFDKPRFAVVENAFPVILDRRIWEETQVLLRARAAQSKEIHTKPTYSDYLLSGLAVCKCGAPVNGKDAGRGHFYYYCSSRKRRGKSVCDAGFIPVGDVDREIEARVKTLLSAEGKASILESVEQGFNERIAEITVAIQDLEATQQSIRERAKRVEQDYRSGDLPAKVYAKELDAIEGEEAEVTQRMVKLQESLADQEIAKGETDSLVATIDLVTAWDTLNVPERKQLLQKLTSSVVLYRPVNSKDGASLELAWVRLSRQPVRGTA